MLGRIDYTSWNRRLLSEEWVAGAGGWEVIREKLLSLQLTLHFPAAPQECMSLTSKDSAEIMAANSQPEGEEEECGKVRVREKNIS